LSDNLVVTFSREIKSKAAELGLSAVGIARAEAIPTARANLTEWLSRGFHGKMAWMEREPEKRSDPRLLMPGAKSVVVAVLNYYTPHEHSCDQSHGKISRYAWGDDYHDVLKEKLKELLGWIQSERPEVGGKVCVDTAPIMDKAWAARAGLGFIGKHSNLITKEFGSWVFIGEIVLDLELDYDTLEETSHCGTCTACLDACPTGAIVEPYVIDSNRCISHATIELRDETLPEAIAGNLDGWLYGCDVCQDVCPWNRFEKPTHEARFEPRLGETSIELDRLEQMEHEEYVERFRRSAMKRTKLQGLKRNAAALEKNDSR
jgi:epoxyqueuosine reductase